jgi:glycosyltransferase involved in cell wall biosynthesis
LKRRVGPSERDRNRGDRVGEEPVSRTVVNFISDIATPHVNELLRAVAARPDVELRAWYSATERPGMYKWNSNPTHEVVQARIFGERKPNLELIGHALARRDEAYVIVGWSNPTTRLLVPMLSIARRPFGFFTDCPADEPRDRARTALRNGYFELLKRSATVFGVGKRTLEYFARRGFAPERLCNLPLPIPQRTDLESLRASRGEVRQRFGVTDGDLFLVTGSRLLHEKGFDILLRALGALGKDDGGPARLLLVGSGPCEADLKALVEELGISRRVIFAPWMEFEDFARAMAAADVVVHPARFDAYGGITLTAVAVGVPVIGSKTAGSAVELVADGVSGFLYDPEDMSALVRHLRFFIDRPEAALDMGRAALETAQKWSSTRVAAILVERLERDRETSRSRNGP